MLICSISYTYAYHYLNCNLFYNFFFKHFKGDAYFGTSLWSKLLKLHFETILVYPFILLINNFFNFIIYSKSFKTSLKTCFDSSNVISSIAFSILTHIILATSSSWGLSLPDTFLAKKYITSFIVSSLG